MTTIDWHTFLSTWSEHALSSPLRRAFPSSVLTSGWLGFPPASEDDIAQVENRLQTRLPPSYRQFLQVSNGWRMVMPLCGKIWPASQVDWLANRRPELIEAWQLGESLAGPGASIPDEAYLIYGVNQDPACFRSEYLESALEISDLDVRDDAIYLLNPKIVDSAGEWEVWFFASWLPGAVRYRSFSDLMQAEYRRYLESLQDIAEYQDDFIEYARGRLADEQPEHALIDLALLVAALHQKIEAVRSAIDQQAGSPMTLPGYQAQRVEGLEHALHKVMSLQREIIDPPQQSEALTLLAKELDRMALANAKTLMKGLDTRKMALAGLLAHTQGKMEELDKMFQAGGKSAGYSDAAGIIREFLSRA